MLFVTIFLKKNLFSEGLNETFLALAQIIETVYQYSAKWDQPKKMFEVTVSSFFSDENVIIAAYIT